MELFKKKLISEREALYPYEIAKETAHKEVLAKTVESSAIKRRHKALVELVDKLMPV